MAIKISVHGLIFSMRGTSQGSINIGFAFCAVSDWDPVPDSTDSLGSKPS